MIVSCDQEKLNKLVQTALRSVSNRATMPILSGVLIKAESGKLTISGTDLEMSIKTENEADVKESGTAVVSGKLIGDITKGLPGGEVKIESSDKYLMIKTLTGEYKVKEMIAEDYPKIPSWEGEATLKLNGGAFLTAVQQTSRASSSDEKRPVLTGTLIEKDVSGGIIKMVTTDSYRLSYRELDVEGSMEEWEECIVPTKALNEVARIAGSTDEDIEMMIKDRQIIFKIGNLVVSSRLIEGQFPGYNQLIPKGEKTKVTLDKAEITAVVKRAMVFGNNLRFGVSGEQAKLSTETPEVGESREEIAAEIEGEETEVGFNGSYLLEGVTAVESDKVVMRMDDPQKPVMINDMDSEKFKYILMPVRLR